MLPLALRHPHGVTRSAFRQGLSPSHGFPARHIGIGRAPGRGHYAVVFKVKTTRITLQPGVGVTSWTVPVVASTTNPLGVPVMSRYERTCRL